MAIRRPDYERMIAERDAAEDASRRAERRYWIVTLVVCLAWCALGGFITALGFTMVLPEKDAWILIDAGQGIAAAGVVVTVLYAGHHRRRRGYD